MIPGCPIKILNILYDNYNGNEVATFSFYGLVCVPFSWSYGEKVSTFAVDDVCLWFIEYHESAHVWCWVVLLCHIVAIL